MILKKDTPPEPASDWRTVSLQRVPEDVARTLASHGLRPPSCQICVQSKMRLDGRFGECWLAVGSEQIAVVVRNGHPAQVAWTTPLNHVMGARSQSVTGGGVLILDVAGQPEEVLRYDSGQASLFGGIAGQIDKFVAPKREEKKKREAAKRAAEEGKPPEPEAKPEKAPAPPVLNFGDLLAKQRDLLCGECGRAYPKNSKVCPFCIKRGNTMLRILKFAGPYKKQIVAMGGLMIFEMLLNLVPPQIMRIVVDRALISDSRSGLMLMMVVLMGLVMLLRHATGMFQARLGVWVGSHITTRIQQQAFNHLQQLSMSFFTKHQTGALMSRINSDARQMQGFLTEGIQYTVVNILVIVGVSATLLIMNPFLGFLVLVPAPLVVIISGFVWRYLHRRWRLAYSSMSAVSAYLNDALSGARVIKAFGRENDEVERFERKSGTARDHMIDAETTWQTVIPLLNMVVQSSTLLVWYFGAFEVYGGRLTLGGLMAYVSYLGMIYGPLQLLSRLNDWFTRSLTAAARVFEILDTEPEIKDESAARAMPNIQGHIELKQVVFGYEKHTQVLKGLSLDLKAGQMVGLVGSSGAGKSTLINLIGRLYDCDEGEILVDGVNVKEIQVSDLRRQLGFVLQDTFLFSGTIAENIAYARPDATRKEVIEAAVAANAHEFIMKMPDGYDTIVGERGQRLSGGERQRISIARAILHNPKILILDEATSSVDTITEAKIQLALSNLVKGRTTIAIAHRLSTLRHADRLVVVKDGRVAEEGTHAELMAKENGEYKKLVEIQTEWSRTIAIGGH